DFGMFQQVNLYIQFYKFFRGLSLMGAYQFFKQGESILTPISNDFNLAIANRSLRYQEYTMHNGLVQLTYDFAQDFCEDAPIVPYISVYYKRPFNGLRSVMTDGLGVVFAVNF